MTKKSSSKKDQTRIDYEFVGVSDEESHKCLMKAYSILFDEVVRRRKEKKLKEQSS